MANHSSINHPQQGVYQHTYGDAIGLSCRPTTFGVLNSKFEVDLGKTRWWKGKTPVVPKRYGMLSINRLKRPSIMKISFTHLSWTIMVNLT